MLVTSCEGDIEDLFWLSEQSGRRRRGRWRSWLERWKVRVPRCSLWEPGLVWKSWWWKEWWVVIKVFSLQSQVSKSKDDPRVVTLKKSAISLWGITGVVTVNCAGRGQCALVRILEGGVEDWTNLRFLTSPGVLSSCPSLFILFYFLTVSNKQDKAIDSQNICWMSLTFVVQIVNANQQTYTSQRIQ